MDFEIGVDVLRDALAEHQRVVEKSAVMPVLGHLLIGTDKSDRIRISSSNPRMSLSIEREAEVDAPGSLLLPADGLSRIVKVLDRGMVRVQSDDRFGARIESGRSKAKLVGLDPGAFPGALNVTDVKPIAVSPRVLAEAIGMTIYAASMQPARSNLCGVNIQSSKRTLSVTATDGHRLATVDRTLDGPASLPARVGVTIPVDASRFIASVLAGMEVDPLEEEPAVDLEEASDAEVEAAETKKKRKKTAPEPAPEPARVEEVVVSVSENDLQIVAPGFEFRSRLICDLFPDFRQVIPSRWRGSFRISSEGFSGMVKRSMALSGRGSGISLSLSKGSLKTRVVSQTFGEVSDWTDLDYEGEDLEIAFQGVYLREALGNLRGETIECRVIDPLSPIRISTVEDPEAVAILMPMRL